MPPSLDVLEGIETAFHSSGDTLIGRLVVHNEQDIDLASAIFREDLRRIHSFLQDVPLALNDLPMHVTDSVSPCAGLIGQECVNSLEALHEVVSEGPLGKCSPTRSWTVMDMSPPPTTVEVKYDGMVHTVVSSGAERSIDKISEPRRSTHRRRWFSFWRPRDVGYMLCYRSD